MCYKQKRDSVVAMNKVSLEEKRAQVEERFNQLSSDRDNINVELNRLQGEYRTLSGLIEELDEKATKEPVKTDAKEATV